VLISTRIHANPRAPIDRGILFTSTLFLMVFLACLPKKTPALVRQIAGGFALYASASILCQIGRTLAAAERNVTSFNRWSYAEVAAYLAAVLFWIFALLGTLRLSQRAVITSTVNRLAIGGLMVVIACGTASERHAGGLP